MTISNAIIAVQKALKIGVKESIIKFGLVAEGFKENKAETIIRWAKIRSKEEAS